MAGPARPKFRVSALTTLCRSYESASVKLAVLTPRVICSLRLWPAPDETRADKELVDTQSVASLEVPPRRNAELMARDPSPLAMTTTLAF
eukprot:2498574-Rhodomonas_salina.2